MRHFSTWARYAWLAGMVGMVGILLTGCSEPDVNRERDRLADGDGPITFGVAWPLTHPKGTLLQGAQFAVDEVNAAGGVLGRPLQLEVRDDQRSVDQGMIIAQEFAGNPNLVAAIAHLDSFVAIPASSVYEFNQLVMLSPGAVSLPLTRQGFEHVFRLLPNNAVGGRTLARYAADAGYRRVLVYYINNTFGRDLSNVFEETADGLPFTIVDRRAYDAVGSNHLTVLESWRDLLDFDAIFLAGSLPDGAQVLRLIRELDITVPVFGGVGLDSPELIMLGGADAEETLVPTVFHPDIPAQHISDFTARFLAAHGTLPDPSVAGGYDAVKLLVHAIETAGSARPAAIAEALRTVQGWEGLTGTFNGTPSGELREDGMVLTEVRDGAFQYLRRVGQ